MDKGTQPKLQHIVKCQRFYDYAELKLFLIDGLCIQIIALLLSDLRAAGSLCSLFYGSWGGKKAEAGKLQLDHNHRGHSNAISFPMQSHNPMAQTFALIRHLGNASIPSHFISSSISYQH